MMDRVQLVVDRIKVGQDDLIMCWPIVGMFYIFISLYLYLSLYLCTHLRMCWPIVGMFLSVKFSSVALNSPFVVLKIFIRKNIYVHIVIHIITYNKVTLLYK